MWLLPIRKCECEVNAVNVKYSVPQYLFYTGVVGTSGCEDCYYHGSRSIKCGCSLDTLMSVAAVSETMI